MKTRFFTTIALAVLFLSSCVKEDNNNQITKDKDSNYTKTGNIPFYSTFGEVSRRLDIINGMDSIGQIYEYENSQGYLSVGLIADMECKKIDFERYCNCTDSLEALLNKYGQFIDTTCDGKDIYVDPKFDENPFRHVANEKGLFRVGDTIVRIFKHNTMGAHINEMSVLLSLSEDALGANDSTLFYYPKPNKMNDNSPKSGSHTECAGYSASSPLGNFTAKTPNDYTGCRRIKVTAQWTTALCGIPTCNQYLYVYTFRAYKRSAICFYPSETIITYSWDMGFHWVHPTDWVWVGYNNVQNTTAKVAQKFDVTVFNQYCSEIYGPGAHYTHINLTTSTLNSGTLNINL